MKNINNVKTLLKAAVVFAVALAFVTPVSALYTNQKTVINNNRPITTMLTEWTEQASGFEAASRGIRDLDAVNENVAWAIAYDGSGGSAYTTDVTHTVNGGDLWVANAVLGPSDYGLGNICGLNETVAYASVFNNAGDQDATCGAYKTTNGGTTWTQLGHYPISFVNNVIFWNENEGVVLGDFKDSYFEDYYTSDGGLTWTRVPQANYSGIAWKPSEAGWTGVVNVIGDTVIFGTNEGDVYISHDKGHTYFASYSGAATDGTNPGVNDIAFKDATHGLVAHDAGGTFDLFETSDGGVTWAPVSYSGTAYASGLAYVPGTENMYISTGAASGYSGASYSMDGGHSWTDYDEMIGIQMLATDFVENKIGWAGGFNTDATTSGMWKHAGGVPKPSFSIEVTGGTGFDVKVTNVGDGAATNLVETITITGGLFVKPNTFSKTKTSLAVGEAWSEHYAVKGIGLGILKPKPTIKVDITCDESVKGTKSVTAKIIFSKVTVE
jgi:hypothetical protein